MKIYTKTGDDGTTGLFGNQRVRKDSARIECCGTIDELNAALGLIVAQLPAAAHKVRGWLDALQSDLFLVGAMIATPSGRPAPTLTSDRIAALESQIDQMEKDLPPLKNFILPQGTPCAAQTHVARAIGRRVERRVVALSAVEAVDPSIIPFLNRASDFLFVLARWVNQREGGTETAWIAPAGASAAQGPVPDRLGASLGKLEEEKRKRQTLFEKAASDLERKKREADQLFRQNVDQIRDSGGNVEKPLRDMDLD